jgi:hypothetical protein
MPVVFKTPEMCAIFPKRQLLILVGELLRTRNLPPSTAMSNHLSGVSQLVTEVFELRRPETRSQYLKLCFWFRLEFNVHSYCGFYVCL